MRSLLPRALLIGTAIAVASPVAAGAATVRTTFAGGLEVRAAAGETNAMTIGVEEVTATDSKVTVSDTGVTPAAGAGCASNPTTGAAECTVSGLYIIFVYLGDGDDSLAVDNLDGGTQFTVEAGPGGDTAEIGPEGEICLDAGAGDDEVSITTASGPCIVNGGPGRDVLRGSSGLDRLYGGDDNDGVFGGSGSDYVYGDGGADTVHGGPGDEVLIEGGLGDDNLYGDDGSDRLDDDPGDDALLGGAGNDSMHSTFFFDSGDDRYDGGAGFDRFSYFCPACRISLDGAANDGRRATGEADDVAAESVDTPSRIPPDPDEGDPGQSYGRGKDVLAGNAAPNVLRSRRGDDRLVGKGASDILIAGHGDDTVVADDGTADQAVDCGPGTDKAIVDPQDIPTGCEDVTIRRGGGN